MSEATKTRTCLGCEGTGCESKEPTHAGAALCYSPCPACLGSGTVTERLGYARDGRFVPDAVADAATLRLWLLPYTGYATARGLTPAGRALQNARAQLLHRGLSYTGAREAARAAFRAVPALKG